jgi:hypothetical protein
MKVLNINVKLEDVSELEIKLEDVSELEIKLEDVSELEINIDPDKTIPVIYLTDEGVLNSEYICEDSDIAEFIIEMNEHDAEIERFLKSKGLVA